MRNVWRILVKTNLENAHRRGGIGDRKITIKQMAGAKGVGKGNI